MKERPIIFSGEMVRAILDGRKTQTRRVIKPQPLLERWGLSKWGDTVSAFQVCDREYVCPYGKPGDQLWVRETWCVGSCFDNIKPSGLWTGDDSSQFAIDYKADDTRIWQPKDQGRWRPSIHMPRWASRIDLLIKDVRVERVQEITLMDCVDEGVDHCDETGDVGYHRCFESLWDTINGKKPGRSWADNPWCWVIEFERIKP